MNAGWVAGADGGRRGRWVVVDLLVHRGRIRQLTGRVEPSVSSVIVPPERPPPRWVGLDIPIGLPDSAEPGGRAADRAARAALGPARSSVFSAPTRPALERAARTGFAPEAYPEVSAENARAGGPKLSRQSFFLLPRIGEVDDALQADPERAERVLEVHPEVVFRHLAGRVLPGKKTFRGRLARHAALAAAGIELDESVLALEDDPDVGPDDLLDAAACAFGAWARLRGRARPHPEDPPRDRVGLPMAIWW